MYQWILWFIGELLFAWPPECNGDTSFRNPDQLVMQRERMAEGYFAARNPPQHIPCVMCSAAELCLTLCDP